MLELPLRAYIDLDRTLLDTTRFVKELAVQIPQLFGHATDDFFAELPHFQKHVGRNRYYDFFDHVRSWGIGPDEAEAKVRAAFAETDFSYPDTAACLDFFAGHKVETSILTFGEARFQALKYSLVPQAHNVLLVAVLEAKEDYISRQVPQSAVLIDDRGVRGLPTWCTAIRLDRAAPELAMQHAHGVVINSLTALEKVFTLNAKRV